jgi:uncharacterized protein YodC (DUF2158 family)
MADPFKAGDTVRLKSGGPLMTVTSMGTPIQTIVFSVFVTWFDKDQKPQTGCYVPEALTFED